MILDQDYRLKLIEGIRSNDSRARRGESFKHQEMYNDRLEQYVVEWLRKQFSPKTVDEMPVISCLNIYKKMVDECATIYKKCPEREWSELSDDQIDVAKKIYKDAKIDSKLKIANRILVSPKQCAVMLLPKNGAYQMRVVRTHNYSVIPDPENPEEAYGYIFSALDKRDYLDFEITERSATGFTPESETWRRDDGYTNEPIADKDDYRSELERYVVWTEQFNFIMDGNANIIDPQTNAPYAQPPAIEDVLNPLWDGESGHIPVYDLYNGEKDSEFFIRPGNVLFNFCVQFNGTFSDLAQIVRMQGWSQAFIKGPKDKLPENVVIGPTRVLYLETDPDNPDSDVDFGFASPNANIDGAISFIEKFMYTFLSSRGIDPKTISTSGSTTTYSSALERMLAMIEKMEATADDFEKMRELESWIWKTIKLWNERQPDLLEPDYQLGAVAQDSKVSVVYSGAEAVQTESETLDVAEREVELGIRSRIEIIMERRGVDRERAIEIAAQIDRDKELVVADPQEQDQLQD